MFTRCFERTLTNPYHLGEEYEVINISEYGYEYYVNDKCRKIGLVEDLEETIAELLELGWEEVL